MKLPIRVIFLTFIFCRLSYCHSTKCYNGSLARYCFSDFPPFDGIPLPADPFNEIPPKFHLFREPYNHSRVMNSSNELHLNGTLFVIIHGWTGTFDGTTKWHNPIIENLLTIRPDSEAIFVEWEKGARMVRGANPYDIPAANTRSIAVAIVDFLLLNKRFNASLAHCIGFSLGSHVCGFAGKRLKASETSKLGWGRITALDPAKPNFDVANPSARVDSSDAEFVDVIHTSRLGLSRPVGDVDFYVSGAVSQPGCARISGRRKRSVFRSLTAWATDVVNCSHERAPLYFAETILAQPNYNLSGILSDVSRTGPGTCTFSKFCPCPGGLGAYQRGQCRTCNRQSSQIIGYWSFVRPNLGSFFGELSPQFPYCVQA